MRCAPTTSQVRTAHPTKSRFEALLFSSPAYPDRSGSRSTGRTATHPERWIIPCNPRNRRGNPDYNPPRRLPAGVGLGPQSAARQGEGADAAARRAGPAAPGAPVGAGRQGLCLRGAGRAGDPRGAVRRAEPAGRLSLHVRPGVDGGLPELLPGGGPPRRQPGPSRAAGRDAGRGVAGLGFRRSRRSSSGWGGPSSGFRRSAPTSTATTTFPSRRRRWRRGRCSTTTAGKAFSADEAHGVSVFLKTPEDAGGEIFHTYSSYARGAEELLGVYRYLDLTRRAATRRSSPSRWPGSGTTTATRTRRPSRPPWQPRPRRAARGGVGVNPHCCQGEPDSSGGRTPVRGSLRGPRPGCGGASMPAAP